MNKLNKIKRSTLYRPLPPKKVRPKNLTFEGINCSTNNTIINNKSYIYLLSPLFIHIKSFDNYPVIKFL